MKSPDAYKKKTHRETPNARNGLCAPACLLILGRKVNIIIYTFQREEAVRVEKGRLCSVAMSFGAINETTLTKTEAIVLQCYYLKCLSLLYFRLVGCVLIPKQSKLSTLMSSHIIHECPCHTRTIVCGDSISKQ